MMVRGGGHCYSTVQYASLTLSPPGYLSYLYHLGSNKKIREEYHFGVLQEGEKYHQRGRGGNIISGPVSTVELCKITIFNKE